MDNLTSVGLPNKVKQTFSTPPTYRQLEGPNYWKHKEMAKTSTSIIVWVLKNVRYVKVLATINWYKIGKFQTFEIFQYSGHVQIQNIVKMLKMQKSMKIFETNSHKSYETLPVYIRHHHMTSHEYYQCNTKRKIEVHWKKCKKISS